jgi:hypothetical protein
VLVKNCPANSEAEGEVASKAKINTTLRYCVGQTGCYDVCLSERYASLARELAHGSWD